MKHSSLEKNIFLIYWKTSIFIWYEFLLLTGRQILNNCLQDKEKKINSDKFFFP